MIQNKKQGRKNPELNQVLSSFPKLKRDLPLAFRKIYERELRLNRDGGSPITSISSRLEAWMHRRVASRTKLSGAVLELGAGTLNHLHFEPDVLDYDIVEPNSWLYENRKNRSRIRSSYPSIDQIPQDNRYARIISIAVLEHICDLPKVLAQAATRMEPGGFFQAAIPSEGSLLWGLSWRLSTGLAFRLRTGLDYSILMSFEHVNSAREIEILLRAIFRKVSLCRFPTGHFQLSFYTYLEASEPRVDVVRSWIA